LYPASLDTKSKIRDILAKFKNFENIGTLPLSYAGANIYTTKLEPILPKISEKIYSLRPAAVSPSGTASQKNCLTFFLWRAQKSFQLKERQFFCSAPRLIARAAGLRFGSGAAAPQLPRSARSAG
jgi:hypothetical protein